MDMKWIRYTFWWAMFVPRSIVNLVTALYLHAETRANAFQAGQSRCG